MVSVCLRSERNAGQIEGAVLCAGGGGEDGGEAIAPEADDIAGVSLEIRSKPLKLHESEFVKQVITGSVFIGARHRTTSLVGRVERRATRLVYPRQSARVLRLADAACNLKLYWQRPPLHLQKIYGETSPNG
jgi:hypothetical protein